MHGSRQSILVKGRGLLEIRRLLRSGKSLPKCIHRKPRNGIIRNYCRSSGSSGSSSCGESCANVVHRNGPTGGYWLIARF
jgi:hypothetical protein